MPLQNDEYDIKYIQESDFSINDINISLYNLTYSPEVRTFNSYALKLINEAQKINLIRRKTLLTPEDYKYQGLLRECYLFGNQIEGSYDFQEQYG